MTFRAPADVPPIVLPVEAYWMSMPLAVPPVELLGIAKVPVASVPMKLLLT